jgi:parallel beta-helix repeat protein
MFKYFAAVILSIAFAGSITSSAVSAPDDFAARNLVITADTRTTVNVAWNAENSPVQWRLYRNGTFLSTAGAAARSATFGVSVNNSQHVLGVEAVLPDTTRQLSTITVKRWSAINTNEPPLPVEDTTFPTVSVTSPNNGDTVSGTIAVNANASDNVGVVGVQFKLDGNNLGSEDTSAPYSTSFNTTAVANGSHSLAAVARDLAGNATTSVAVGVTVDNTAPPLPQCSNGINDDSAEDNLIDFPVDPGCTSASDNSESPNPTPPPTNNCTDILNVGGNVQTFMNSLSSGDVGCLRGGVYPLPSGVTWNTPSATLQSFPGEMAELTGFKVMLSGANQTFQNLTVRDVVNGSSRECVGIDDTGIRAINNVVRVCGVGLPSGDPKGSGFILHTSASNAVIDRNLIQDVGAPGSTLHHGVYIQGNGHRITNNVIINTRGGYGIQLYPSSSNIVIAQNTSVGSQTRAGIVIQTSGSNNRVVNNIFANNAWRGINYQSCSSCTIDRNIEFGNGSGGGTAPGSMLVNPQFVDSLFHVSATSPAVNAARTDFSFSPDKDGVARPVGAGPDIGAYER